MIPRLTYSGGKSGAESLCHVVEQSVVPKYGITHCPIQIRKNLEVILEVKCNILRGSMVFKSGILNAKYLALLFRIGNTHDTVE